MSLTDDLREAIADHSTDMLYAKALLKQSVVELDRLTTELAATKAELTLTDQHLADAMGGINELGFEIAALRKDAERYRWLREHGEAMIGPDRGMGPEWTYGEELDAAIDAAMQQPTEPT